MNTELNYEVTVRDQHNTQVNFRYISPVSMLSLIPPESWQPTLDGLCTVYPPDALLNKASGAILVEPERWHESGLPGPDGLTPRPVSDFFFGLVVVGSGHPIPGITLRIERGYIFDKKQWASEVDVLTAIHTDVNRKQETYNKHLN